MKRLIHILAAGVALMMLASCQLPWEKSPSASATPSLPYPHCVQVLSQAMVSGSDAAGATACLDPTYAAHIASTGGPASDADFAKLATQDPVYTSVRYVGKTDRGYYFQYEGTAGPGCFRFHVDNVGHVDKMAYGQVACPSPLP